MPAMPARAPALRTLLRTTTTPPTAALRSSQISRPVSQLSRRTPSPPPPYSARNISLLASTTNWTHFSTPYTLSSVRTFTRSALQRQSANEEPAGATTDPEAARKIGEAIETIQELYGTARDEFEIATEETEKNTTYAADDRAAAREELDRLLEYYSGVLEGGDRAVAEEVKRRVGQRIRELEQAVLALEESVTHGD